MNHEAEAEVAFAVVLTKETDMVKAARTQGTPVEEAVDRDLSG